MDATVNWPTQIHQPTASCRGVVLVHGGAGNAAPDDFEQRFMSGIKEAALAGYRLLQDGKCSVDAVVGAVVSLEDNPNFNAGRGSVLNQNRQTSMHALLMRGDTCDVGGVACLKHVRNPIRAARLVMDHSPHCLLDGAASLQIARQFKLPEEKDDYFVTERCLQRYDEAKERYNCWNVVAKEPNEHDTVGAVALDRNGNLACATSTGGITVQRVGRISDSPIIGSGGFADNNSVAVSTTGQGEAIMKISLARMVSLYVEAGMTPQAAAEKSLKFMETRVKGTGGLIAIDAKGRTGVYKTSESMIWAEVGREMKDGRDVVTYGFYQEKVVKEVV